VGGGGEDRTRLQGHVSLASTLAAARSAHGRPSELPLSSLPSLPAHEAVPRGMDVPRGTWGWGVGVGRGGQERGGRRRGGSGERKGRRRCRRTRRDRERRGNPQGESSPCQQMGPPPRTLHTPTSASSSSHSSLQSPRILPQEIQEASLQSTGPPPTTGGSSSGCDSGSASGSASARGRG